MTRHLSHDARDAFIGNDVVDLADPVIARHHENERFVTRVCSDGERARVATARDLWSLFAAKEAAYKALVKLGASPGFRHREICVAPDFAGVTWAGTRVSLTVEADEDRVHAIAWCGRGAWPVFEVHRTRRSSLNEGRQARVVLRDLVARAVGCSAAELEVVRDPVAGAWDGYGPPYVLRAGVRIETDVSLSHDGRFVGAAALLPGPCGDSSDTPDRIDHTQT
jgi:phosphopantetheinyl transferase (holo-ACP synthase)